MSKKVQRSYTTQYKVEAMALVNEIGGSAAAKQLNVPINTIYGWQAKAKRGELPDALIDPQPKESLQLAEQLKEAKAEIAMLRSETAQLKKEKEILENATVFFAARHRNFCGEKHSAKTAQRNAVESSALLKSCRPLFVGVLKRSREEITI